MSARTQPGQCPFCAYRVDGATSIDRPDVELQPKEGDYSICVRCRSLAVFRADQTLRFPTSKEAKRFREMMADRAAAAAAQRSGQLN